jgi:hypothetical protein
MAVVANGRVLALRRPQGMGVEPLAVAAGRRGRLHVGSAKVNVLHDVVLSAARM